MKSRKMIVTGLAAFAAIVAGCSNNSDISGPETNANYSADRTFPEDEGLKDLKFEATVKWTGIEGGCWYLETDKGERFEPTFGKPSITLKAGMRLLVQGFVLDDQESICMIAPVIRIIDFVILPPATKPVKDTNDAAVAANDGSSITAQGDDSDRKPEGSNAGSVFSNPSTAEAGSPDSRATRPRVEPIVLRGILGQTKDGCYFLRYGSQTCALDLPINVAPLALGSVVEVTGDWSLLTYMLCNIGPVFNVRTIHFLGPRVKANHE